MRRKELMARALAAGLAAVQVGGSISPVVYASEATAIESSEAEADEGGILSEETSEETSGEDASLEETPEESSKEDTSLEETPEETSAEDISLEETLEETTEANEEKETGTSPEEETVESDEGGILPEETSEETSKEDTSLEETSEETSEGGIASEEAVEASAPEGTIPEEEQIMLAAEAEHTVTFNYNMPGTSDLTVQAAHNTIPDEPEQPTRDGYIFTGWTRSTSSAGSDNYEHFDWNVDSNKITKDTTFYAKWVPAVTVTITDHFYDLEGNEVAVIPRDTVTMCKGAYFSNSLGNDWWHDGLNPYCGGASLAGYCSETSSWEWIQQYAKSGVLSSDYDVSQLVVDTPAEIKDAYEHFKRETVYVDSTGNQTTGVETDQRAITNGRHNTSSHDTDHYVYGDETIDYYYREIPVYTYEVVDHYGAMADGSFVEDHQQSRGTESFRGFYLKSLNKMKVAVNPDGAYNSLVQIKYHGYKTDSSGIKNTTWGAVVTDKDALVAVDETLTGDDVVVTNGFLGSDSDYRGYCVGDTTIDLYYVSDKWSVGVTDEVYGLDGKLISSTQRELGYFTKGDRVVLDALADAGYMVTSIESTSGDALDSINLDGGQAVIDSLSQNTGVTFKYTAYPADNTLQIVEVIKDKSGRELSRTEKPMVSYDIPTNYIYTPPTGCRFSRLVKGVYKTPSGEQDAGLTYEGMTTGGFSVVNHMYVELEFVKEIKLTVNKHTLDSEGNETGVQTDTVDFSGTVLPDAVHNSLPLLKYSYTYTPSGGTETTVEVADVSSLSGITVVSDGDVTLDAYYQEKPVKKYSIKVIDETYDKDQTTLIQRTEREVKEVPEGTSYTVSAQTPDGYYNLGNDTVTGTADADGEVVFKYSKYIVLNIEDVYNESDGTLIERVSRTPVRCRLSEEYSVAAQPEHEGYTYDIIGADKYEGTAAADADLTFTYRKKAHHKVTIIDKYYEPDGVTPIEEVTRPEEYFPEGTSPVIKPDPKPGFDPKDADKTIPNISGDTEVIFEYVKRVTVTVVDEYYAEDGSTLVDSVTRPAETYKSGSGYSITPQAVHGGKTYTVMNPEVLSGTATSDITVIVRYRCDERQKKMFKIAVYDEFYGADGTTLRDRVLRSNNEYVEGSSQTFSAVTKAGYFVFDPASGTITVDNLSADTEVVFKYRGKPETPDRRPSGGGGGSKHVTPVIPVTPVTPPAEPEVPPTEPEIQPVVEEQPIIEPEKVPVKKEFTVTVIDKCFDHNGTALISYDRRLTETLEEGAKYSYSALDFDGFKVRGVSTHEGTVHGNLVLEFTYIREAQYTITVVDKYVSTDKIPYTPEHPEDIIASSTYTDTEGGTTYTVLVAVRQVDVLPEGSSYEYHSKEPKGFITSGQKAFGGTVDGDMVLEFTYVIDGVGSMPKGIDKPVDRELVKPQKVLITVVDKYISEEPISDGADTVTVETVKGEDGKTYVVTGSVRVVEALLDGSGYEYKALDLDGFNVRGSRVARGKATSDKTVEFVYTAIDDPKVPAGVINHQMSYAKKTADDDIKTFIPYADEPKTGEGIPLESTGFMALALALIEYLKRKLRR